MPKAIVGGDPNASTRQRQFNDEIGDAVNSLVRRNELTRTTGRNRWTISAFLGANYQPLDSDLTAIAALSTTAFGRSLLTLANLAALQATVKSPIPLFDHFADAGNTGTGEDDLYSDTLAAGRLGANGDKLDVLYAGYWVGHATATRRIRLYFGGTAVLDTDDLLVSDDAAWEASLRVIRVSSSVVRVSAVLKAEGSPLQVYTTISEITGLTLSNAQVVKITGEAADVGAADNDIVARMGHVIYTPSAT